MAQRIDGAEGRREGQQWGHHWKDPERVQEYVERTDAQAAERGVSFRYLLGVIPFEPDQAVRVLDIGSGHGVVAAAVLDHFPRSSAIGLDVSEAMMEIGRQRMAPYGERFRYHVGDFGDGSLPADLPGPFDIVVSSRAIHHLPTENKERLYRAIFQVLDRGGCFFNLDVIGPRDEYLKEIYRRAGAFVGDQPAVRRTPTAPSTSAHGHFPETVASHLRLLEAAGFQSVDCFWKQLGNALVGGYRRIPGGP